MLSFKNPLKGAERGREERRGQEHRGAALWRCALHARGLLQVQQDLRVQVPRAGQGRGHVHDLSLGTHAQL